MQQQKKQHPEISKGKKWNALADLAKSDTKRKKLAISKDKRMTTPPSQERAIA